MVITYIHKACIRSDVRGIYCTVEHRADCKGWYVSTYLKSYRATSSDTVVQYDVLGYTHCVYPSTYQILLLSICLALD